MTVLQEIRRSWDILTSLVEPLGWETPPGCHRLELHRERILGDFKLKIGPLLGASLRHWGWYWEIRTRPSATGWASSHAVSGGRIRDPECITFRRVAKQFLEIATELIGRMRVEVPGWAHGWDRGDRVEEAWSFTSGPHPKFLSFPHFRRDRAFTYQFWRSMKDSEHWNLHRDDWGREWSWTVTNHRLGIVVARGNFLTERSFDFTAAARRVDLEVSRFAVSLGVYR